jgi:hypothetical protein
MCIGWHNFRNVPMYLYFVMHLPGDDHMRGQNV